MKNEIVTEYEENISEEYWEYLLRQVEKAEKLIKLLDQFKEVAGIEN